MTNETRNRIRTYMEELPRMKEKVFGALLMLVIAAIVVTSSSYAWVTLSRAPEVSDITTTLAANGALEIALSNPDGTIPAEFDIDDSLEGSNPSVVVSNLQWGNLVNLSDPSYGIGKLALRPTQLQTASLLYNPLWGVTYGEDGRITSYNSNFTYAVYNGSQFEASSKYGVRAISSYTFDQSDNTAKEINKMLTVVTDKMKNVTKAYGYVVSSFGSLGDLISRVAQDKINKSSYAFRPDEIDSNLSFYLPKMYNLYVYLEAAMKTQQEAYVALANLQHYQWCKAKTVEFVEIKWADLESKYAEYTQKGVSLTGFSQYLADYNTLAEDMGYLKGYVANIEEKGARNAPYYWSHGGESGKQVVDLVNRLVDYNDMFLIIDNQPVYVRNLESHAKTLAFSSQTDYDVYTEDGILKRFEESALRSGARMNGNASCNINVSATVEGIDAPLNISGHAYSTAEGSSYFELDIVETTRKSAEAVDKLAEDTYGLAIDLWVRTNTEETCLTLEGATSTDEQGNIVSYDGINRVWGSTGEANLTTNSTTQGGGSCYVYYADADDMLRSLELLKAMKVAFVDAAGDLLATAEMDTEHPWAVNGRVTVPLVLNKQTKTTYTYMDIEKGEQLGYAVTTLYADEPMRITAIIYLDGDFLTNEHVLAAAEIEGTLNIQFGSSTNLKTVGSNELINDTRTVSASVSKNKMNYTSANSREELTTTVTVNVEGTDPTNVTAFFVRAINATQGSREGTMTFTKVGEGKWTVDHTFTAPGTYYLRQVRLDGVDYTLDDPPMVEVDGFALEVVDWSEEKDFVTVRTSRSNYSTTVTARFATNDLSKRPGSVKAIFMRDDGNRIIVPLTYNASGDWQGTVSFSTSGVYMLQFLETDGQLGDIALSDGSYRTLDLSLDMYVTITNVGGTLSDPFEENHTYYKDVEVQVFNNVGAELYGLTDLKLHYSGENCYAILTWDAIKKCYTGQLPLMGAGRFRFSALEMGDGSLLTRSEGDPPVYIVVNPNPPEYDPSSECEVNENGVQFIPLSNDAVIDGIKITNSASAVALAVVYSEESGDYYVAEMDNAGDLWHVKLPTYNVKIGEDDEGNPVYKPEQDGRWSVAAIKIWDCYDGESDDLRTESNPILWVDSTLRQGVLNYLESESGKTVTPDRVLDFSKLTTEVSNQLVVTMNPGITALGSEDKAFGSVFQIAETKMSVTLWDGNDDNARIIPYRDDIKVTLTLEYTKNDNKEEYGYKVRNNHQTYVVELNTQDPITGARTVSNVQNDRNWSYVGEYKVVSLTVKVGEIEETYYAVENEIPNMHNLIYTVTTAGPTEENVRVDEDSVAQGRTAYVNNAANVESTFLDHYNMDATYVRLKLIGANNNEMQYAVYEDFQANLILTYKGGSEQYGKYSISGDPVYEDQNLKKLNLVMEEDASQIGIYRAPADQVLLAGIYGAQVQVKVGSNTRTFNLSDITVTSKMPDVTMGLYEGTDEEFGTPEEVQVNKAGGSGLANPEDLFKGNNVVSSNGYSAALYIEYEPGGISWGHSKSCGSESSRPEAADEFAHYIKPKINFTLKNAGMNAASTMKIEGNDALVSWASGNAMVTAEIGSVKITPDQTFDGGKYKHQYKNVVGGTIGGAIWGDSMVDCLYKFSIEEVVPMGTVIVDEITTTACGATFTRTLDHSLVISVLDQENPTLTWAAEGVTITVTYGSNICTGTSEIPVGSALTATVKPKPGYHDPRLTQPDGVYDWRAVSEGTTEAVYTFTMPAVNAKLSGIATEYPKITFSNANSGTNYADVSVMVEGEPEPITSGTGGRIGAEVTVTVTAIGNYCLPTLARPVNVAAEDWHVSEGDRESVYTFTMPNEPVKLDPPETKPMQKLTWQEHTALDFFISDNGVGISDGKSGAVGVYVVPGHTLTVTLIANGGMNPELVEPANATKNPGGTEYTATYTCVMPEGDLCLVAKADSYPVVKLDNAVASFAITSNNEPETYKPGGVSIMPGKTVVITLTAKDGHYAPRMSAPSGSGIELTEIYANDQSAQYSFVMPWDAVDFSDTESVTYITATPAPEVSFGGTTYATLQVSYTDYERVRHTVSSSEASSVRIQPGAAVTVIAAATANYYNPTVSSSSLQLPGGTVVTERVSRQYTFTMGHDDADLTAAATPNPAVTFSGTGTTMYLSYTGYSTSNNSVQVRPGTAVTIQIKATDGYYIPTNFNPTVSGVSLEEKEDAKVEYVSRTYTFTMPEDAVSLTNVNATDNPTVKHVKGSDGGTLTVSINGGTQQTVGSGNSIKVRPGSKVEYSVSYAGTQDTSYSVQRGEDDLASTETYGDFIMNEEYVTITITSTKNNGCVTPDTTVILADGTKVRIDSLTGDELLLVWNMETGTLDSAPIMFVDSESADEYEVICLYFSDGTEVKVIYEHGFWDYDLNRYVYLDNEAGQYIGHSFAKKTGEKLERVTLVDVVIRYEQTSAWSPVTVGHLCYFVNDMLSMPGGVGGLFNIFDVDSDTMSYDLEAIAEDIATYGLFTYEELNDIVPLSRDMFEAAGGAYLKISIGKGNLTMEELIYMIQRYSVFFE